MTPRTVPFAGLAEGLRVEDFDRRAPQILDDLDRDEARVGFGFARRSAASAARDPYRAEVSRIPVMDRAEELRFTMGLELLELRLRKARREAGLPDEEPLPLPDVAHLGCLECEPGREIHCLGCAPAQCSSLQRARIRRRTHDYLVARNELVERNLHLVFRLLERYRHVGVPVEDLVQEANLSLFKAVENFDFRRGVLFKTYAAYWINQAFLNAIYNQSRTVRVPAYIQKAMKKLSRAASTMESGLADVVAAAREAAVDPELAASAVQGNRYTSSLNRVLDAADGAELVDLVPAPDLEQAADGPDADRLRQHLFEAVARLSQREQAVLEMRYGLGGSAIATLAEVGQRLGISLERVRQIQAAALDKIRRGFKGPSLEQYA